MINIESKTDFRHEYTQYIRNDKYLNCQRCKAFRNFLEYGCDTGGLTGYIAEEYKAVYAVESSKELLEKAKKNLKSFDNIFYITGEPKLKVDYIFSYSKLQHMPKELIQQTFEWFYSIMKQKAILKVMLKGKPDDEASEFYTMEDACHLAQQTRFRIFKTYGEGERYFWLWMARL